MFLKHFYYSWTNVKKRELLRVRFKVQIKLILEYFFFFLMHVHY